MDDEKRGLLLELREHTVDCDCNRYGHFTENTNNKKWAKKVNLFSNGCFIITILCAVWAFTVTKESPDRASFLSGISAGAGFLGIAVNLVSYIYNFEKCARDHWLSAQAYTSLYRKCQFFCSLYYNSSIDVWREKLDDIAEELGRISLIAPPLDKHLYDEWKNEKSDEYPVDYYIKKYNNHITDIINDVKIILQKHDFKIYLYGSYMQNMFNYDDIDIAIIIFDLKFNHEIQDKIFKIALNYLEDNQNIDLNIIFEDELEYDINKQYYKNIIAGKLLYSSPNVKEDLNTNNLSNEGYKKLALSYKEATSSMLHASLENINLDIYRTLMNDTFYMYYNTFAFVLSTLDINWDGEDSCISKFNTLIHDKESKISKFGIESSKLDTLVEHTYKIYKYKQQVYLQADKKYLNDIKNYLDEDKLAIDKLLKK